MAFQLLLLLIGGVSGQRTEEIQRGAGETVTVHCGYGEDYKNYGKIWCRETGRNICDTILITSLQRGVPRVKATSGRTLISDNKETQRISVTVQKLEKPDAGVYWCGVYLYYTKEVLVMKQIVLRISEDFTNVPVRIATDSTDESQNEEITSSEGSSLSDLYIILIAVGVGVLFLLTAITLFYVLWARKRKNERVIDSSDAHSSPGQEAFMNGTPAENNSGTISHELNSQEIKYATLTLHARRDQEEATYSNLGFECKQPVSDGRYNSENVEYASINLQALQGNGDAL
ncbi:hypothetical protein NDU88_004258 [Pleurodeles waltl]|uniref:Immunoglobulin V-set domain-containing protein n=2 Tax=Pleurodeles waltl TaxID=8319 RepID=A0AAV7QBE8_PLEWA|nr:hypothetical protein NDU88_004258 [Pleurodeles waltl]